LGSGQYTNTVSGDGTGVVAYTSGTPATATVNASTGAATLVAAGTTVITATKAPTATYAAVADTCTLTVHGIGTPYGGGIIACILGSGDPGYVAGIPRGLIADIYIYRTVIGNFSATIDDWSSSEYRSQNAWSENFSTRSFSETARSNCYCVRAVRSF
jgi:hypothetical protein